MLANAFHLLCESHLLTFIFMHLWSKIYAVKVSKNGSDLSSI